MVTFTNDNIDKIYHVMTESSAKKWSQKRLPGTQRFMQQQRFFSAQPR
jgi:hypothetical protein